VTIQLEKGTRRGILPEPLMTLTIELEQETDGRWIAEIPELPGVLVYGATAEAAARLVRALAFRVLADQLEAGEVDAGAVGSVSFAA
jgi:predicted RNase H-like HicB family nuclease